MKQVRAQFQAQEDTYPHGAERHDDDRHGESRGEVVRLIRHDGADQRERRNSHGRDDDQGRQLLIRRYDGVLPNERGERKKEHAVHPRRGDPPHHHGEEGECVSAPRCVADGQADEGGECHPRDAPARQETQFRRASDELEVRLSSINEEVEGIYD